MSVQESPARWRRAKEIFSGALDAPPHLRAQFIREQCGSDGDLVREVEELLLLHGESGLALDQPPPIAAAEFLDGSQAPFSRRREGEMIGGRYRIGKWLGGGGMGEVHEALDTVTGEQVAIKTIRPFAGAAAQAEARFLREARMARAIEHPNVCRVFGIEEYDGERFCVMELLEGESLAARLQSGGPLKPDEALPVALGICEGLAAAHRAGVLHRDLKPGNIVLTGGRAVIIDFGLAAALAQDASLTAAGEVIGTLAYMAPEQLAEGTASPASDIYALGVVLHEMLTGRKPHSARSPLRLAAQKARESHRTPRVPAIGVPPVWREVIERCLRSDPGARFPSAHAVAAALRRGRPSAGFVLSQPRVLAAVISVTAVCSGWIGWRLLQKDYVPSQAARAPYEQAQAAIAEAAPLRAVRLLEQSAAADPRFIAAHCLLASAHADLDQPEKARDAVLEATAISDRRWVLGAGERLHLRAARATVTRNHGEAARQYKALADVSIGQRKTFALASAAKALDQAGDRQGALETLRGALASDPGNAAAHVRYGLLLSGARQHDLAREEFRIAETAYEKSGNLEGLSDLLLARSSARLGGYEADRTDLERVLALSEKTGNRYHNLTAKFRMAAVAEQQRDYEGAVRVAREAAEQARREGMPIVAAQALGELGYAFVYMKKPELAAPILEESVEMAERAKATGVLANNRMRLGEVLGSLRRPDDAVRAMEPAVRWLRESGSREAFPLTLIKWGTVLTATTRNAEAGEAFREALDLATRDGNEMYRSMAVQRMGGWNADRDPVKAAEYFERTVILGRKTRLTGSLFQAASAWTTLGRLERAEQLIAEGDVEKLKYPPGVDRDNLEGHVLSGRAWVASRRGQCEAAESLARQAAKWVPSRERDIHLVRACSADPGKLRESLAWLDGEIARLPATDYYSLARNGAAMAAIELGLGNWRGAKERATKALEASNTLGLRVFVLESSLALRAAERRLGNGPEAGRLGAQCVEIARSFGFDPPEAFGGRQDLVRLWNLGRR